MRKEFILGSASPAKFDSSPYPSLSSLKTSLWQIFDLIYIDLHSVSLILATAFRLRECHRFLPYNQSWPAKNYCCDGSK